METKYGKEVDAVFPQEYLRKFVDKIFKFLPLKEEVLQGEIELEKILKYHESLMLEFIGFTDLFIGLQNKSELVSLQSSLESLMTIDDLSLYRRKVFECINLCKKIM